MEADAEGRAPAARSRVPAAARIAGVPEMSSTSISRQVSAAPSPAGQADPAGRDEVVGHFGEILARRAGDPPDRPGGIQDGDHLQRLSAGPRRDLAGQAVGHTLGAGSERGAQLPPAARGDRQLQVPARIRAAGPAPEGYPGRRQGEVSRVVVAGRQVLDRGLGHAQARG